MANVIQLPSSMDRITMDDPYNVSSVFQLASPIECKLMDGLLCIVYAVFVRRATLILLIKINLFNRTLHWHIHYVAYAMLCYALYVNHKKLSKVNSMTKVNIMNLVKCLLLLFVVVVESASGVFH